MQANPTRVLGLDAARCLAIAGMIIAHMASLVWTTTIALDGIPSAMFAIIAGTTMMLIGRNYTFHTFLRLVVRGALVALIGIALLPIGGEIQIVLLVMGIAMVSTSWIPALNMWARLALFAAFTIGSAWYYSRTMAPAYPLITWIAYFIGGMLLHDIYLSGRKAHVTWSFGAIFLAISVLGFALRFSRDLPAWLTFTGHSGGAGEILLSLAVTAVVLHICLLLHRQMLLFPFAAMGAMSLTIYVLHVLTAAYWQEHVARSSTLSAFGFILLFLVLATLWRRQGPLELTVKKIITFVVPNRKARS